MEKLHILLNYKREILSICLRAVAGFFPVIIAFSLPIITGINESSLFFENYAKILILSSLLRLGIDLIVLKKEIEINQLISYVLIILVLHIFLGGLYSFFSNDFLFLASLFFSLNIIISSFVLSNGERNVALLLQFLLPSIFIILLSFFLKNPFINISISYGLPFCLTFLYFLYKNIKLINFNRLMFINLSKTNFYLVLYTIFSISVSNIPIIIGADFLSNSDVIWINKTLKLIGISSFVSAVIVFNFNNKFREIKKTSFIKIIKISAIPLYVFYIFSFLLLSYFLDDLNSFSLLWIAGFSFVLTTITIGNICGHLLLLNSKEIYILISIVLAILICLTPIYFFEISKELLLIVYILILVVDSIFKSISLWKKI